MVYRYFYDCEFIEDGRVVDLVSIGVVDEFGREFYAVSTEFDDTKAIPWVRRNVLDKLPSPSDRAWRSRERIRRAARHPVGGNLRRLGVTGSWRRALRCPAQPGRSRSFGQRLGRSLIGN